MSLIRSVNLCLADGPADGPTNNANIASGQLLMRVEGGDHHYNTYDYSTTHVNRQAGHTKQPVSDNPILNSLANIALAGERGIYQGVAEGVGAVVAKKIIGILHEPADEKMARSIHYKNQKLLNLSVLRHEVNSFSKIATGDSDLENQAQQLRLGYGYTLLEFIEQQKKESADVITPFLPKLREEIQAFAQDAQGDDVLENLSLRISKTYGVLLAQQMEYEKKYNKPTIIVAMVGRD